MAQNVNDPTGAIARKRIWFVFALLSAITAIEFIFAFAMTDPDMRTIRAGIFLALTVVKAYYIIADFMHLKHETRSLIITEAIPIIFLVWFIVSMLVEGAWYGPDSGWFRFLNG